MTISIHDLLDEMYDAKKYVISMYYHQLWYFYSLKEMPPSFIAAVWTPHLRLAKTFNTEETVEEFKMHFISPRKVNILRI